jgi:peroxiredoxin
VAEWNLPSEPWTFIIDKEGKIHEKFEQFTTGEEIEAALNELF